MKEIGNGPTDKGYKPSGVSKAWQRALEAYPDYSTDGIWKTSRLVERLAFRKGYEQAEKDILTWQMFKRIVEIADQLMPYESVKLVDLEHEFQSEEAYYKEVLKRFKEGLK